MHITKHFTLSLTLSLLSQSQKYSNFHRDSNHSNTLQDTTEFQDNNMLPVSPSTMTPQEMKSAVTRCPLHAYHPFTILTTIPNPHSHSIVTRFLLVVSVSLYENNQRFPHTQPFTFPHCQPYQTQTSEHNFHMSTHVYRCSLHVIPANDEMYHRFPKYTIIPASKHRSQGHFCIVNGLLT